MAVMQEFGERLGYETIVDSGGEKPLLRVLRKIRPDLQGRVSEQLGKLVFVHGYA
jgi:hypothetical protein